MRREKLLGGSLKQLCTTEDSEAGIIYSVSEGSYW